MKHINIRIIISALVVCLIVSACSLFNFNKKPISKKEIVVYIVYQDSLLISDDDGNRYFDTKLYQDLYENLENKKEDDSIKLLKKIFTQNPEVIRFINNLSGYKIPLIYNPLNIKENIINQVISFDQVNKIDDIFKKIQTSNSKNDTLSIILYFPYYDCKSVDPKQTKFKKPNPESKESIIKVGKNDYFQFEVDSCYCYDLLTLCVEDLLYHKVTKTTISRMDNFSFEILRTSLQKDNIATDVNLGYNIYFKLSNSKYEILEFTSDTLKNLRFECD